MKDKSNEVFENLPIVFEECPRGQPVIRSGTLSELLKIWDIDDPEDNSEMAQVLRHLRQAVQGSAPNKPGTIAERYRALEDQVAQLSDELIAEERSLAYKLVAGQFNSYEELAEAYKEATGFQLTGHASFLEYDPYAEMVLCKNITFTRRWRPYAD